MTNKNQKVTGSLFIREILIFWALFFVLISKLFSQQEETFQTNNPNYHSMPLFSYQYRGSVKTLVGFDLVVYKYYSGFYMGMSISTNGAANSTPYNSNGSVILDNGIYSFEATNKYKTGRGSITVGYIRRLHYHLFFYAGGGYGWFHQCDLYDKYYNGLFSEKVYARNLSRWYGGIETCSGFIFDLHRFSLNAGISILNFKKESMLWTGGIGIYMNKKNVK